MAGIRGSAQTAKVTTGTAKKTLLQLVAAANHRVLIKEISISFAGVTSTAKPIHVQVQRQTSAGTMSSLVPLKMNTQDGETLQTTALHTATAEPTSTDIVLAEHVHPQGGIFLWQAPFGGEIVVPGGERIGICVTATVSIEALARIIFDE